MSKVENFIEYIDGGLDCSTEGVVKLQDTIARLSKEELAEAYYKKRSDVLFALTKAWNPIDVITFYNELSESPMNMYKSKVLKLEQVNNELVKANDKLQNSKDSIIKAMQFEIQARSEIEKEYLEKIHTLRIQRDEALTKADDLGMQVLVLKAKLYDLMTGGEENA